MIGVLSLQNRSVFMGDGGDNVIHLMCDLPGADPLRPGVVAGRTPGTARAGGATRVAYRRRT